MNGFNVDGANGVESVVVDGDDGDDATDNSANGSNGDGVNGNLMVTKRSIHQNQYLLWKRET